MGQMRVISKTRLKSFWKQSNYRDSEAPLRAWHTHVKSKTVSWKNWADVKADFANASLVGNCVVFNIGGNKYRLVTRIIYPSQKVFVLRIMTHVEYDQNAWKKDCGCYAAPPQLPRQRLSTIRPPLKKNKRS